MKEMKRIHGFIAVVITLSIWLHSCTKSKEVIVVKDSLLSATLSGVLKVNSRFSIFDTLLVSSGFRDSFYAKGPYTVFATTDGGFNEFGLNIYNETVFSMSLGPKGARNLIRQYYQKGLTHLASFKLDTTVIITMADAANFLLTKYYLPPDTLYLLNGALLDQADIMTSNGALNVLGGYASPLLPYSVMDEIYNHSELSLFARALQITGLDTVLSGKNLYTVFAPTNNAFSAISGDYGVSLPNIIYSDSLLAMKKDSLAKLLKYHIIKGRSFLYDLKFKAGKGIVTLKVLTLSGDSLRIDLPLAYQDPIHFYTAYFKGIFPPFTSSPATIYHGQSSAGAGYYSFGKLSDIALTNGNLNIITRVLLNRNTPIPKN